MGPTWIPLVPAEHPTPYPATLCTASVRLSELELLLSPWEASQSVRVDLCGKAWNCTKTGNKRCAVPEPARAHGHQSWAQAHCRLI